MTWPWNYTGLNAAGIDGRQVLSYGDEATYIAAAKFLDHGPVEDWGCGPAYAKRFFSHPYLGVDGAAGPADVIADLRTYTSNAYGILLRHVLEHNFEWEQILWNALASCERLALVMFTPFGEATKQIAWNAGYEVPDISFRKQDLIRHFQRFSEEAFPTGETIFYVQVSEEKCDTPS